MNEFGDPTMYYREVVQRDAWPLIEAAFIIAGYLPLPECAAEEIENKYPIVLGIYRLAIESIAIEKLNSWSLLGKIFVKPREFVQWAITRGLELPEPLLAWAKEKKIRRKNDKINDHTRNDHQKQVQALACLLWVTLKSPNQTKIFEHSDMKKLLNSFINVFGSRKTYTKRIVISWIAERDPRKGVRRGRPRNC